MMFTMYMTYSVYTFKRIVVYILDTSSRHTKNNRGIVYVCPLTSLSCIHKYVKDHVIEDRHRYILIFEDKSKNMIRISDNKYLDCLRPFNERGVRYVNCFVITDDNF